MNRAFAVPPSGNFRLAVFLLTSLILFQTSCLAESRVESRAVPSKILGRAVHYTVLLPPSYDTNKTRRYPVLYYLHGLGDNDQTLVNSGGWDLVEELQRSGAIGDFLIVTPDGGRSFYINSKDGRVRYDDFFIREFIPAVEQRYRTVGTRAGRGISGTSMGGYGALRFAFRYPELFAAVSAHMPAIAEELPGGIVSGLGSGLNAFGNSFDPRYWKQNSPFTLVRQQGKLTGLQIYFDCGLQDDFGFNVGSEALHRLLETQGIPHEFHLYPGRHSGQYVAAHFPASLRFQSRALGAKK